MQCIIVMDYDPGFFVPFFIAVETLHQNSDCINDFEYLFINGALFRPGSPLTI